MDSDFIGANGTAPDYQFVYDPTNGTVSSGDIIVRVDPRYFRPAEVETLLGDPAKARAKLGWEAKTSFQEMVREMVREDVKAARRDELVKDHGFQTFDYHE